MFIQFSVVFISRPLHWSPTPEPQQFARIPAGEADQRREGHFSNAHVLQKARKDAGDAYQGLVRGLHTRLEIGKYR